MGDCVDEIEPKPLKQMTKEWTERDQRMANKRSFEEDVVQDEISASSLKDTSGHAEDEADSSKKQRSNYRDEKDRDSVQGNGDGVASDFVQNQVIIAPEDALERHVFEDSGESGDETKSLTGIYWTIPTTHPSDIVIQVLKEIQDSEKNATALAKRAKKEISDEEDANRNTDDDCRSKILDGGLQFKKKMDKDKV